jgi:hypothetical protein
LVLPLSGRRSASGRHHKAHTEIPYHRPKQGRKSALKEAGGSRARQVPGETQQTDDRGKDRRRFDPLEKDGAFDYIKTNTFRSFHADGVWGRLNGQLDIVMAFYSERPAIPQRVVHSIEGERIGQEIESERVVRDAHIRDVEIAVSMNAEVAKSFHEWLGEKIEAVEMIRKRRK